MSFLSAIFGNHNQKELYKYGARLSVVNSFAEPFSKLTLAELKNKTAEFKNRLTANETEEKILPEAFATVRETASRTLKERHYDVQIIGGMVIADGKIAEMRTGEGKTLVATLPAYLKSLSGKGVHVVTVNDYLARRDAVWMGQIYDALGVSVSVINQNASYIYDPSHAKTENDAERDLSGGYHIVYDFLRPVSRREAYEADITYGTNSEFGFDYLRDNIEYETKNLRQRPHHFAIIDEIDSILIDEARTPLIISSPSSEAENLYVTFAQIAQKLNPETDYEIDEKFRAIRLLDPGIEKAEKILGVENIYTEKGVKFVHHLETAIRAKALFHKDKHYVVRDNQIVIIDEFTGRMQPSRRWSEGLHQAIEAKEGVEIAEESRTFASISYQNYFKLYEKLSGMTGTAKTSSEEFFKVYLLDTITIPTNKPIARADKDDFIFQTEQGKLKAVARKIKELHQKGQPVLVGTVSIEKNELLSEYLIRENVPHNVLNAKNHEKEAEIIAQAGKKSAVTIATNMAGRGVDIKLGGVPFDVTKYEEVKSLGGLYVLGTERHEARRIDNQLRGRSGRQGDPGETQFFVSLDDDLMRVFGSTNIKGMMGRFGIPEDQPIQNKFITRALESAQSKIEGFNFDARKHLLEYDSVMNTQRRAIYSRRKKILFGEIDAIENEIVNLINFAGADFAKIIEDKRALLGDRFHETIRRILLQTIDTFWVDHLETIDYVRSSVNLRAYGQRDPLVEYKKEALRLYKSLEQAIYMQVVDILPHVGEGAFQKSEEKMKETVRQAQMISGDDSSGRASSHEITDSNEPKIGRNERVVLVKDGEEIEVKFKKAEEYLQNGWQLKKTE